MSVTASGHKCIREETIFKLEEDWLGYRNGVVRLTPGRWLYPTAYTKFVDKYFNLKFKQSDVVVNSWPKCGTTWVQEIVWTMKNNPDLNHPLTALSIFNRSPFLECIMSLTASGHKCVVEKETDKMKKDWVGYPKGLVRVTPGRWLFTAAYTKFADKYYNFKFKQSDVVVNTWPKCGTTWVQEIVWTMTNNPDLNHPMADLPVVIRSPFLEFDMLIDGHDLAASEDNPLVLGFQAVCPGKNPADGIMLQISESASDPRIIKTHLPLSLLSPSLLDTAKVVYIARNPKDVLVSYCHHSRILKMHGYVGSFEDFVQYFVDDDLVYSPYWLHVKEAWEKRHHPNMHFIFYEDLKTDVLGELNKLNTFLDTKLTEDQLNNIVKHTSYSEMKVRNVLGADINDSSIFYPDITSTDGGFFRKGETGDWKSKLTPELEAKVDSWISKNAEDIDISFKYSL